MSQVHTSGRVAASTHEKNRHSTAVPYALSESLGRTLAHILRDAARVDECRRPTLPRTIRQQLERLRADPELAARPHLLAFLELILRRGFPSAAVNLTREKAQERNARAAELLAALDAARDEGLPQIAHDVLSRRITVHRTMTRSVMANLNASVRDTDARKQAFRSTGSRAFDRFLRRSAHATRFLAETQAQLRSLTKGVCTTLHVEEDLRTGDVRWHPRLLGATAATLRTLAKASNGWIRQYFELPLFAARVAYAEKLAEVEKALAAEKTPEKTAEMTDEDAAAKKSALWHEAFNAAFDTPEGRYFFENCTQLETRAQDLAIDVLDLIRWDLSSDTYAFLPQDLRGHVLAALMELADRPGDIALMGALALALIQNPTALTGKSCRAQDASSSGILTENELTIDAAKLILAALFLQNHLGEFSVCFGVFAPQTLASPAYEKWDRIDAVCHKALRAETFPEEYPLGEISPKEEILRLLESTAQEEADPVLKTLWKELAELERAIRRPEEVAVLPFDEVLRYADQCLARITRARCAANLRAMSCITLMAEAYASRAHLEKLVPAATEDTLAATRDWIRDFEHLPQGENPFFAVALTLAVRKLERLFGTWTADFMQDIERWGSQVQEQTWLCGDEADLNAHRAAHHAALRHHPNLLSFL